jgi:hypothetical protein
MSTDRYMPNECYAGPAPRLLLASGVLLGLTIICLCNVIGEPQGNYEAEIA